MLDDKKIFKCNVAGIEKEFEILYTFQSFKTGKDYIIYTDNTYDNENNLTIYAAIYFPQHLEKDIENIENEADWNEVELFLKEMSDNYE